MSAYLVACPDPVLTADLPVPYFGYYELWSNGNSSQNRCVLNVLAMTPFGQQVFVRTVHGDCCADCEERFADWIGAQCESPSTR